MKKIHKRYSFIFHMALVLCLALSGCSCSSKPSNRIPTETLDPNIQGSRDNSPTVLVPAASGVDVHSNDSAIIDTSNASEGYIMAQYTGSNKKVKLQIKRVFQPQGLVLKEK